MKIVTWNVNSIRARERRVLAWLEANAPDVLCLQELKVEEADYPTSLLEAAGYHSALVGQKTYNGVAVLSREPAEETRYGLDDGVEDPQARLVAAKVSGVWVLSAYFPNGGRLGSAKYTYKLEWMARLRAHLDAHYTPAEPLILAGDFNVAPEPIDRSDSEDWEQTVLASPEVRAALDHIRDFGFTDLYRVARPDAPDFSWWDYRSLSFPKNNGLRIDHDYGTEPLVARVKDAHIDRDERKKRPWDEKGKSSASDHAPVVVELDL